jgi:hypothetical protein
MLTKAVAAGGAVAYKPIYMIMLLCVLHCGHAQGRTGPYFQDFNNDLIEDLLDRYPNLVRPSTNWLLLMCPLQCAALLSSSACAGHKLQHQLSLEHLQPVPVFHAQTRPHSHLPSKLIKVASSSMPNWRACLRRVLHIKYVAQALPCWLQQTGDRVCTGCLLCLLAAVCL